MKNKTQIKWNFSNASYAEAVAMHGAENVRKAVTVKGLPAVEIKTIYVGRSPYASDR